MTAPASRRDDMFALLLEMEDSVANLVRWARVLRDLGTVDGDVASDGLFAIGGAMLADASSVQSDWKECLELSRQRQGGCR